MFQKESTLFLFLAKHSGGGSNPPWYNTVSIYNGKFFVRIALDKIVLLFFFPRVIYLSWDIKFSEILVLKDFNNWLFKIKVFYFSQPFAFIKGFSYETAREHRAKLNLLQRLRSLEMSLIFSRTNVQRNYAPLVRKAVFNFKRDVKA